MDKSNQNNLVKKVVEGDLSAFEKLYHLYFKRLRHFAFTTTKSEFIAEDIVQGVFIRIWSQRGSLTDVSSFKDYVYKMVYNRSLNHLRDAARRNELYRLYREGLSEHSNSTGNMVMYTELEKVLLDCIDNLPPKKKEIYKLYQEEGRGIEEIGELLNISLNTVRKHLYSTMSRLKGNLQTHLDSTVLLLLVITNL